MAGWQGLFSLLLVSLRGQRIFGLCLTRHPGARPFDIRGEDSVSCHAAKKSCPGSLKREGGVAILYVWMG